jgi:Tol biopolymer transport system component
LLTTLLPALAAAALAALALAASSAWALGAGGVKAAYGLNFGSTPNGPLSTLTADGHYLFFQSWSPNLDPEAYASGPMLFRRDLTTGETHIVKPAPETNVASFNAGIFGPIASTPDGRFVAAYGTSGQVTSLFVHDLQTNTTELVNPNDSSATVPSISADGRFVAFESTSELDPADTDDYLDVYVRDLQSDTTTLVSRADGTNGLDSDLPSQHASISADGRYVAFESSSTYLDPNPLPEPACTCIYRRDLQTGTTILVSRNDLDNDPATLFGNYTNPMISADGRLVAFLADRSLNPDDGDTIVDAYVRDTVAHTTALVDRANGANGVKANGAASSPLTVSSDGRFIGFASVATNLSPDDSEHNPDGYIRDLQTNTTTLADRATGASGAKASAGSQAPTFAGGGGFIAFNAVATNFTREDADIHPDAYVRDLQTLETSLESRATPGYALPARPKGATPFRMSLVPAAQACTAPNRTHGAPLSFGSCAPVVAASPNLTVSDGEVRARSVGYVKLKAFAGNASTPADEADVSVNFALSNVMKAADLSDYTGELQARATLRRTDLTVIGTTADPQTTQDFDFKFTIPCVATASTTDGSQCNLTGWADVLFPGFAPEGKRTIYELDQFKVYDGGPDGDADTPGDNSLFAVQGVFVP